MSNSIAPGSSADVNVKVTALTTNPNVPVTYKTIILKKNLVNGVNTLTQEMMSVTNIKYVIKYDYVLGEDITVPANCVLEFDGGSISDGNGENKNTITGVNTDIEAGLVKIFGTDVILTGSWNITEAYPEWFGAIKYYEQLQDDSVAMDSREAIQKCLDCFSICYLSGFYYVKTYSEIQSYNPKNSTWEIKKVGVYMRQQTVLKGTKYTERGGAQLGLIVSSNNQINMVVGVDWNTEIEKFAILGNAIYEDYTYGLIGIGGIQSTTSRIPSRIYINKIVILNTYYGIKTGGYIVSITHCKISYAKIGIKEISTTLFCAHNYVTNVSMAGYFLFDCSYGNLISCACDAVGFSKDETSLLSDQVDTFTDFSSGMKYAAYVIAYCNTIKLISCGNERGIRLITLHGSIMCDINLFSWHSVTHTSITEEQFSGTVPNDYIYINASSGNVTCKCGFVYRVNHKYCRITDAVGNNKTGLNLNIYDSVKNGNDIVDFVKNSSYSNTANKTVKYTHYPISKELDYNYVTNSSGGVAINWFDDGVNNINLIPNDHTKALYLTEVNNIGNEDIRIKLINDINNYSRCYGHAMIIRGWKEFLISDYYFSSTSSTQGYWVKLENTVLQYKNCVFNYVGNNSIRFISLDSVNSKVIFKNVIINNTTENSIDLTGIQCECDYNWQQLFLSQDHGVRLFPIGSKVEIVPNIWATVVYNTANQSYYHFDTIANDISDLSTIRSNLSWNASYCDGSTVTINNIRYACSHDSSGYWVTEDGIPYNVKRSGTFSEKPASNKINIGFKYFCTDKQTVEGATDGIEIIHKGNDVWVDALGRVVS